MPCHTFQKVALAGLARDEAPQGLASAALEARLAPAMEALRLPRGLIAALTGIEARRLYPEGTMPSQVAARAAETLLRAFDRGQVEALYSTSVCRDHLEPSTASIIQSRLGLGGQVKSLDIGSACLGFMDGLELAAMAIEGGYLRRALVVAGENSAPVLGNTVRALLAPPYSRERFFASFATLTLGSGGAAMLVGHVDDYPAAPRLTASAALSDAGWNHLCRGDMGGMETDSAALLKAGVALAKETFGLAAGRFGWGPGTFSRLICHQVSAANTRKFCQALGLDEGRLVKTYPLYGNMGAVAVPFTLSVAREGGLIAPGDRVALMGIGSGLACAMMEIQY